MCFSASGSLISIFCIDFLVIQIYKQLLYYKIFVILMGQVKCFQFGSQIYMEQQTQQDYGFFQKHVLLMQGGYQIYCYRMLNQPITLQTMTPLDCDPLEVFSTRFLNQVFSQKKQRIEGKDIWKGLVAINKVNIIKCLLYFTASNTAILVYTMVALYLFKMMYGQTSLQMSTLYWLVGLLCSLWFYQGIFIGVGYVLLGNTTSYAKGVLFYSIYQRILQLESAHFQSHLKGKILNTMTEFHGILQDGSVFISQVIGASVSTIGIFVLLTIQIGWLSSICFVCCCATILTQYLYSQYNSRHLGVVSKLKDKRMAYLSQTISALKYIKMQRWQGLFLRRAQKVRQDEFKRNLKYGAGSGLQQVFDSIQFLPLFLLLLTFIHHFQTIEINSKLIAVLLILLSMLRKCLFCVSLAIKTCFQLSILYERIAQIFNVETLNIAQEFKENHITKGTDLLVQIKHLSYSYIENSSILDQVSLNVNRGQFLTIIGQIGSGKTTFVDCISRQLNNVKGSIQICSQFIYLQQQSVLFSGILRNNIIMNSVYDPQYYNEVVDMCCLKQDFQTLENGDMTYIQQKVTNLSGGQKARIALARALYTKSKLLLLDDPLSSLDIKVGQKIFSNLLRLCKERDYTIVMALHQTNFITASNRVYVLEEGKMRQIAKQQINSLHLINMKEQQKSQQVPDEEFINVKSETDGDISEINSQDIEKYQEDIQMQTQKFTQKKTHFVKSFLSYIFNCKVNYLLFPLNLTLYILSEMLNIFTIKLLSNYDDLRMHSQYFQTWTNFSALVSLMIATYFLLLWLRVFLLNACVQFSNKQLFKDMTFALMRTSLSYFKGKSSGDILAKYAIYLGTLDVNIVYNIGQKLLMSFSGLTNFIYLIAYKPQIAIFLVLLIISLYFLNDFCGAALIALRQQSLIHSGAPILTHFQQSIKGIKTIRCFKLQSSLKAKMASLLQNSLKSTINYYKGISSAVIYCKHLSSILLSMLFMLIVKLSQNHIKDLFYPTIALFDISWGFYLIYNYALYVNSDLSSKENIAAFIHQINKFKESVNISPNSTRIKPEPLQETNSNGPIIQISDLTLKYNESSPAALKNINVDIKCGQKVAIVGRTGSGKSSFVQALYRLLQPQGGSAYFICGKNALDISLEELRGNFSCIPQQPFVFHDTLRRNLDPFGQYTDREIEAVLSKLNLLEIVAKSEKGIDASFEHKEINLSYGETQLVCLARAILEKKSILVMDEATSNIDEKTETIIKSVIREEFKNKTVISIAHKLLTVLDYDEILVFQRGEVIQRGKPKDLISRRQHFYKMVAENQEILDKCLKELDLQK